MARRRERERLIREIVALRTPAVERLAAVRFDAVRLNGGQLEAWPLAKTYAPAGSGPDARRRYPAWYLGCTDGTLYCCADQYSVRWDPPRGEATPVDLIDADDEVLVRLLILFQQVLATAPSEHPPDGQKDRT